MALREVSKIARHSRQHKKKLYGEGMLYAFSYNANGKRYTKQYKSKESFNRGYNLIMKKHDMVMRKIFIIIPTGVRRCNYISFMKEIEEYDRLTQPHGLLAT